MLFDSGAVIALPSSFEQREHDRTTVGAGVLVDIALNLNGNGQVRGLAVDGSLSGCGVVAVSDAEIESGQLCSAIVGGAGPIDAKIVWVRELDDNVLRLGLQYL